ncbi:MAG: TIR domain-containing protein [Anaerolineae bacterium]|nr:TIR domain-containing protein [Anaerolineae bacterium]
MVSSPFVFISYSRQDYEFVRRLIADLQAEGIQVWIDQQGLQVGTPSWERAIRDAIRATDAVVLIASPDSGQSRYVRGELHIAEMYKRPVYPVWAAGEMWAECVPLGLIEMQHTDARGNKYAKSLLDLLTALRTVQSADEKQSSESASVDPDFIPRNPYKGLRAFTGSDTGDFFGRDGLVKELVEAVGAVSKPTAPRFLAIVGPSGSGKSSVVMAGLLPKLQSGALPGSKDWVYLDPVLPGAQPLESLAVILADALNMANSDVLKDLDANARGLHLLARRLTKGRNEARAVLLVDQFEELFTQTMDADKRDHFIDLLVTSATEPGGQLLVILTLRADFYDRPMNYAPLGKLLEKHTKSVLPMSIEDLRDVIEKPAALPDVKLEFEPGLVGDLLFEVRGQTGALPLLQFTLDQLAERRQGHTLTNAAYQDIGGVKGALAKHAEAVYQALPSDQHRELARSLFLRLIEPGATEQDTTRRRAAQSELVTPDPGQTELLREVSTAFVDARLLTTNVIAGLAVIEVSHEALIREWDQLAKWLNTAREDVHLQHDISRDTTEWINKDKNDSYLYTGTRLSEAIEWTQRMPPSHQEMEFINASIEAEKLTSTNRESQRILLQTLLDNTPDFIYVKDVNSHYILANKADLQLKGQQQVDEVIGKTDFDFFPIETASSYFSDEQEIIKSGRSLIAREELVIDQRSGIPKWFSTTKIPWIVDGRVTGIIGVGRDISESKQVEDHLRTSLEKEKELNELKSRFVSTVSHGYKTPLTVIMTSTEMLLQYSNRLTEERKLEHLTRIKNQVQYLVNLIEDILSISRINDDGLRFNPANLSVNSFFNQVIEDIQKSIASSHQIVFRTNGPCADFPLDERLMRHITNNLISNAVKYSPLGSTIRIEVICEVDKLMFSVRDNGIGIPTEDQAHIFDAFHRANNVGHIAGTGLGLSIAKASVEAHGGTITFESKPNEGTTFAVTIPKQSLSR